jgi:hypothetical protein
MCGYMDLSCVLPEHYLLPTCCNTPSKHFLCLQPTPALYLTGNTLYCIKGLACTFNAQHEFSSYETTVLYTLTNVLIRLLNVLLIVKFLFLNSLP